MAKTKYDHIEVGEIIGFHGIKGEMKVKPYAEIPERFLDLDRVFLEDQEYKIKNARVQKGHAYLILETINDRTTAEAFRNKVLKIDRSEAGELEEDEYFIVDLIGFPVIDKETGEKIGTVKEINQTSGPVDTFVIKTTEKEVLVPALKEYLEIYFKDKKIEASIPQELFEL